MDQLVPDVIPAVRYDIRQPADGKWEIDVTILKSSMDLSLVEVEKNWIYKIVDVDGWSKLAVHQVALPFDNSIGSVGTLCHDSGGRPYYEACVYVLLQPRGMQFVVHAFERKDGTDDTALRNLRSFKKLGYEVDTFNDTSKYFHTKIFTPTRLLEGTRMDPIGKCEIISAQSSKC
jgi:hypothetical protein